jgi:hypothetical protein
MRRVLYWIGAFLLIVALIILIFGAAVFIAEHRWPFNQIWGAFLLLLVALVLFILRRQGTFSSGMTMPGKALPVRPKNYRQIALYAVSRAVNPVVFMNRKRVEDFSETGPVTQKGIRECRDFEILDGGASILGFHDHPDEMWVAESYVAIAEHCAAQGWMKIQGPAT